MPRHIRLDIAPATGTQIEICERHGLAPQQPTDRVLCVGHIARETPKGEKMPLAEYLASEQAREDVKALLAKPCPQVMPNDPVGWRHYGIQAIPHPAPPSPWMGVAADYGGRAIALPDWRTITAYYRPDGARYVVTDLGDGFRAACLRGFDRCKPQHIKRLLALTNTFPNKFERDAPLGTIELRGLTAADLPDAICRVMLASLRVAQS